MADLLVGNVDADVSDEELIEFLAKYGFPAFDAIERVHGSGARPAVVLSFTGLSPEALRRLQPRIHNMYWRNRTLTVQVMPPRQP
ncbi:RNA-binding protein [Paraburkholderia oxyphila]|uniref:hypothetical protein n=1 Tax=Paraburkholderia oxyphila TaxID=614212 RepID=UPI00048A2BFA|nr:hypothetical protein [Paraburkholderia oxyphila]